MLKRENMTAPKSITYEKVYNYALEIFGYDKDKTNAWWVAQSDELNGIAPYQMVKEGKGRKLMKILERCGS